MFLTDFHVHSDVSMDCSTPMEDMVRAEAACGIEKMCFTNHCDMIRWDDFSFNPRCLEIVPESIEKLSALREKPLPLKVGLGLELAEAHHHPELACRIAASEELDFVIGSLHILPGLGDLYFLDYSSPEMCERIFGLYLTELEKVAAMDFYDVLAHIGYGRRYMWRQGVDAALTLDRFGDRVEALLRTVIDKGRGIEINCSGIRDGCGPFPSPEILKLYRALGGEIITVGSDAHTVKNAAKCVREGYEVLRSCGFEYVSVFDRRKPTFIKL